MTAYFMVRAQVVDAAIRDDFDRWYQDEHLPDALEGFKARRAWRGWSAVDASVHYAFYEFDDLAHAQAIQGSAELKRLVAEFDRAWGDKVKRSRDFVEVVQSVAANDRQDDSAAIERAVYDGMRDLRAEPPSSRHTLAQLEKEQRKLERSLGRPPVDKDWVDSPPRGRETL